MEFNIEKVKDSGVDVLLTTGVVAVGIHAVRKAPKYAGWGMVAVGIAGLALGGKSVRNASVMCTSLGAISVVNQLTKENGVPAITGIKGMVNKVIPQLNGFEGIAGLGNAEMTNEQLLGMGASAVDDNLLGLDGEEDLDQLSGVVMADSKLL